MILLRADIAWVETEDGRREPFDAERLAASIHRAAARAGQGDLWIADSVALALHHYVQQCTTQQTIALVELVKLVIDVLEVLGHKKTSDVYAQHQFRVEVRLDELAHTAGAAFELEFFTKLDAALGAAADGTLEELQLRGLRPCVLQLRGARRWSDGCRDLAEEIVGYVRARVERMRPARAAALNMAVVE